MFQEVLGVIVISGEEKITLIAKRINKENVKKIILLIFLDKVLQC